VFPLIRFFRLTGLPKLSNANNAGTKNTKDCTLILTEGDSVKALAIAGLGVVGHNNFGVFPLRGKLLNVREARHDQIMKTRKFRTSRRLWACSTTRIIQTFRACIMGGL